MAKRKIKVAEMFAGVGGFRLALDGYHDPKHPEYNMPAAGPFETIWANQWLSFLQWLLFHPKTSRRRTDSDRRKAFELLLENDNAKNFRELAQYATRPKRIAARLILLAANGWMAPAKLFFRCLYYPLAERSSKINS